METAARQLPDQMRPIMAHYRWGQLPRTRGVARRGALRNRAQGTCDLLRGVQTRGTPSMETQNMKELPGSGLLEPGQGSGKLGSGKQKKL